MHLNRIQEEIFLGMDSTSEIIRQIGSEGVDGDLSVVVCCNGPLFAGVDRSGSYVADRCDNTFYRQSSGSRIGTFLKYIVPVDPVAYMICRETASLINTRVTGGLQQGCSRCKNNKQGLSPESRQEFFHNERGEWSMIFLPVLQ